MNDTANRKRPRRSEQEWRALLKRYRASGGRVGAFCQQEGISEASFYRWRSLLGDEVQGAVTDAPMKSAFVDLGALGSRTMKAGFELKLDLGGGLILHLVRS